MTWQDLQRSAILVLDDEPGLRDLVTRCLAEDDYEVVAVADLSAARQVLATRDVLVLLSDVTLARGERGLDLLAELSGRPQPVPVIVMTASSDVEVAIEALKQGAWDFLTKPFELAVLRAAVRRALEQRQARQRELLLEELAVRRAADEENLEQFLVSLATIIDAKSRFTARHSLRVSGLARIAGEALGYDRQRCDLLALGGRLHDIGKIGTPDAILDKPGPLTREEYARIQEHPALGDELVAPIKSLARLRPMIRWHHEAIDGRGYPDRLREHEVPEEAWVIKVADYWEAITARRPYRDPMPLEKAVRCLRAEAGVKIPRDFVETFLDAIQGAPIALPTG